MLEQKRRSLKQTENGSLFTMKAHNLNCMEKLVWEKLFNSPYFSNIISYDYRLFKSLQIYLNGFWEHLEMSKICYFRSNPKAFYIWMEVDSIWDHWVNKHSLILTLHASMSIANVVSAKTTEPRFDPSLEVFNSEFSFF